MSENVDTRPLPGVEGVEVAHIDGEKVARQEPDENGRRTDPDEFRRFHQLLTAEAPDDYSPHYIRCEKSGKAPANVRSWKRPSDRLSLEDAIEWLEAGGNVGIAGVERDCLVDLDIDDPSLVESDEIKPTLRAGSRSRPPDPGGHAWYFGDGDIPNIDSSAGEVRTNNQYVVAPGSHVPIVLSDPDDPDLEDIPEDDRHNVGKYTIKDASPVARLEYEDIPEIYREEYEERKQVVENRPDRRDEPPEPTGDGTNRSAVFDLDITDVTGLQWGYRGVNPIGHHSNDTKGNDQYFKIDRRRGARDFKDNVTYSPASWALADAGKRDPSNPNGGLSDKEYLEFWKYAKDNNLVPEDDPIPRRALVYVALEAGLCDREDVEEGWKLPPQAFNETLEVVRGEHGVNPGREPLDTPADYPDSASEYFRYLGDVDGGQEELLKACLEARDDNADDLEGETPPYEALVAVAEWADLIMADPDAGILGKTAHRYAREIFAELERDDL